MKITEEQMRAIQAKKGNWLVFASFGSGKSSSYTARVAKLIMSGVEPHRILGLTFTKDAAKNMQDKLDNIIGKDKASQVHFSTFHSFAYKMLRLYTNDYYNINIVEPWFENQIANDIVGKPTRYNKDGHSLNINAGTFLDFVSYQKGHMIRSTDKVIINDDTPYFLSTSKSTVQSAFELYCKRMKNANKMSFNDMLLDFYYLLLSDNSVRESIKNSYDYVQVDEFQDSSIINLEILKMITDNNLFVVGDSNQSIFSFQFAEVGNMIQFESDFEDVQVINLPHNFRSTQNIIDICNDLLVANRGEEHPFNAYAKQISGTGNVGKQPMFTAYNNSTVEAIGVADKIEAMMAENPELTYNDFAIISRTNNGLLAFENELSNREIPVIISSGRSFYDRNEIDTFIAYGQLYIGEDDDAFRRAVNKPTRFIANSLIRDLEEYAHDNDITLEQAVRSGDFDLGRYTTSMHRFMNDIDEIRSIDARNAEQVFRSINDIIGYESYIQKQAMSYSESVIRQEGIDSFYLTARRFKSVKQLFGYIQTVRDNSRSIDNGINLTTTHSAKGLEWETCFVVGLNDSNYPHAMLLSGEKDEELRLLFVAMGRAKTNLFMSYSIYDGRDNLNQPSRFIEPLFGGLLVAATMKVEGGAESSSFRYEKI